MRRLGRQRAGGARKTDPGELAKEVVALIQREARHGGITLKVERDADTPR
jgi:hypothetical protein